MAVTDRVDSAPAPLIRSGLRAPTCKLVLLAVVCMVFATLFPFRASAAVTISSFDAQWEGTRVVVRWTTAMELNSAGFHILRSDSANGPFTKINSSLIPSQCLGCISGESYSFTDSTVVSGKTYYYKLQSVENNGSTELFGPVVAAPASQPSPTPTATRTRTRTNTPLPPTSTATRTPTLPPAPTATALPSATRTPTLPPGVTRAPSPTLARVAVAKPSPTSARPEAGSPTSTPPQIALARKEPTSEETEETAEDEESTADSQSEDTARMQRLIFSTVILLSGLLGFGALLCGVLAVYLFVRVSRR